MIKPLSIFYAACLLLLTGCNPWGNRSEELFQYNPDQFERVVIDYRLKGSSDTTLVFIHGWNLNQSYWDFHVENFQHRYRTLTLDLAGHGNSGRDRKNWTAESFARDIVNIIRKEDLTNLVLVGHSMGGEIALQVFGLVPEKIVGIVGVDTFKDVDFEMTREYLIDFETFFNRFKRNYASMADDYARKNIRSTDRSVINRIVKDYKSADPKIALAIFKYMIPKYEENKLHLGGLPFPLYIIASDYAPVDEEALRKHAKQGYEIKWIYNAGHFPMVEEPQQFGIALDQFLKNIQRSS